MDGTWSPSGGRTDKDCLFQVNGRIRWRRRKSTNQFEVPAGIFAYCAEGVGINCRRGFPARGGLNTTDDMRCIVLFQD